jgi:DNA-binding response OmpR family regulator
MMTTSEPRQARPSTAKPPLMHGGNRSSPTAADAMLEFGGFRITLRRRQLVADGVPIKLRTRAFDLLLVLLEADGSLVTKDELLADPKVTQEEALFLLTPRTPRPADIGFTAARQGGNR